MRILIESTVDYLNMGDLAMLQVCLSRLRSIWPNAAFTAFTTRPDRLQQLFPGLTPVFPEGRDIWFRQPSSVNRLLSLLPGKPRWFPATVEKRLRSFRFRIVKRLLSRQLAGDPAGREVLKGFLDVLHDTDLYVIAGMGSITSCFEPAIIPLLKMIPLVHSLGIRTAAFSQGVGPIEKSSLTWDLARRALPLLDFIALREGRSGPVLLKNLGVPADRVVVTGDDAIELACLGDVPSPSNRLGVSLRVTGYSRFTTEDYRRIGGFVKALAGRLNAEIVAIPISNVPEEWDLRRFAEAFASDGASDPVDYFHDDPAWAIRRARSCRMIITGTYHAAVFALSQGRPAICLVKSDYYWDKFMGLAEQFGAGCIVLRIAGEDIDSPLTNAVESMWHDGYQHSRPLLNAATRQVDLGRCAYAELPRRFPKLLRVPHSSSPPCTDSRRVLDWHRYRIENLEKELQATLAYLRKVEEARDWHNQRAIDLESRLSECADYVRRLEAASKPAGEL